ncbi:mannosyltransferase putative-domain-containing protein, partial [Coniella lustricola]
MRLTRRLLTLLVLCSTVVFLIRYRANVENTIIEKTFDAVAYAQAVEEEAASKLAKFQLPQVILPFGGGGSSSSSSDNDENEQPSSSSSSSSSSNRPLRPLTTQKADDGSEITGVGAFWAKWSKIIHEARPDVPKITLSGHAQTQNPSPGQMTREPYHDHVRQSMAQLTPLQVAHRHFVERLEKEFGEDEQPVATSNGSSTPSTAYPRHWSGTDIFKGRGIVMVGGGEYFGPAIISLHMLRRTGSTLPVEVFVPNDDEYEEELCTQYLDKLNAKCVVLSHILDHSPLKTGANDDADMKITHYQLKSLALLLSSFSDALLLDSDSIPLADPATAIFNVEPYLSRGTIIWPDFWRATESPKFWTIAGRAASSASSSSAGFPDFLPATSSEAGQLAINKATHLAPLLLATYYNIFGPDHYYPLLSQGALGQGDKETFLAATVSLNASYYRVKTPVASLGRWDGLAERTTAMVQHSAADDYRYLSGALSTSSSPPLRNTIKPLFLHSNTPKMNAGHLVDEGDLTAATDHTTRLRLLGKKDALVKQFGFDVEESLWDLLVQTGC